jgi:uncharacterized SAM-binding protein YcdF (DUF218 family)
LLRGCLTLVLVICLIIFAVPSALRFAGNFLVEDHAPIKADADVVLAGDWTGERVLRAGQLVKEGYAPYALVSGPTSIYGINEAKLSIDYATSKGFPSDQFVAIEQRAFSTREEAELFYHELKKRGIHSILLVTSNFHTHRAAIVFRKRFGGEIQVTSVAAPSAYFVPDSWWKEREGQKTVFYEWSKMIATPFGM